MKNLEKAKQIYNEAMTMLNNDEDFVNKKIFKLFKKSAKMGLKEAQFCLSICYAKLGKKRKMFNWMRKSAVQNYVKAQETIAIYLKNNGNYSYAEYWFTRALNNGDEDVRKELEELKAKLQEAE